MDTELSTVAKMEQITEKIAQIEARMERFFQVYFFNDVQRMVMLTHILGPGVGREEYP